MKRVRAKPRKSSAARRSKQAVEPNLIVTIDERHRTLANAEIKTILARLAIKGRITNPPEQGLVGVYVGQDPRACIERLRQALGVDPFAFQHTHRWLPIEEWCRAEVREMARFAQHAMAEISPDETWAIKAERHGSELKAGTLIRALARGIDNRHVDLNAPDKTVLLEIVGQRIGLAVLAKEQSLSVEHEMKSFVEFEEVG